MKTPDTPRRRRMASGDGPDPQIRKIGKRIKLAYTVERNNFESFKSGGLSKPYVPPKTYDGKPDLIVNGDEDAVVEKGRESVWNRLAKIMIEEKIDPQLFMASQFMYLPPAAKAPDPPQMLKQTGGKKKRDGLSPKAVRQYEQARAAKGEEIETSLAVQKAIAKKKISYLQAMGESKDDSCITCIVDDTLELSALFRYCLAVSIGGKRFRRVARIYETQACIDYLRYKKYYSRYWESLLPEDFAAKAKEVYEFTFAFEVQDDGDEEEV